MANFVFCSEREIALEIYIIHDQNGSITVVIIGCIDGFDRDRMKRGRRDPRGSVTGSVMTTVHGSYPGSRTEVLG